MKANDRIKMLRIERGLTQDELAKRMGYADRSMLTKIEAGKVSLTVDKVSMFAEILGVDPVIDSAFMRFVAISCAFVCT